MFSVWCLVFKPGDEHEICRRHTDLREVIEQITNESVGLCCLRMSHTNSTEDTDEPNSALLLGGGETNTNLSNE